jgi:hypothetical protein
VSRESGWAVLTRFDARSDAAVLVKALRAARIPAIVAGARTRGFGPGRAADPPREVEVRVPREFLKRARDVRDALGGLPSGGPPPDDDPQPPDRGRVP